ncbi:hypothetical protein GGS26DRAFT_303427 [Hypomontagnella submonticulosa]|nr:hypothetical protein GGS26DRAFT_303427 [Hypomontagnella submonticulosa]
MADNTTDSIDKGASGEPTVPESQPDVVPAAKGPVNAAEDSMEPSIATNTVTTDGANAPSTEPIADDGATVISSKKEVTEKLDAADKLASQPEKSTGPGPASPPSQPAAATETAATDVPSLSNGEAKEPPKPVTVEEVRDQDMPAAAPTEPVEMTGALPVQDSVKETPKAAPAPTTTAADKSAPNTGEKRKPDETGTGATNGDATAEKPVDDSPAEKKQKTNGAATNGTPRKVGRPKKDKTATPPVGRTARKTRSQGTAD